MSVKSDVRDPEPNSVKKGTGTKGKLMKRARVEEEKSDVDTVSENTPQKRQKVEESTSPIKD